MELADSAHTVARMRECENARMNAAMGAGKTGMSRNGPHFNVRDAATVRLKLGNEQTQRGYRSSLAIAPSQT